MLRNYKIMTAMGIKPKTIIHVGSHYGQDNKQYELLKVENIFWCEADPICASELRSRYPKSRVIEGVFWSVVGKKMEFWIMKNRAQNSLFPPKFYQESVEKQYVFTTTLDREFRDVKLVPPIMLVLDVQGAEIEVLRGANKLLLSVNFVICEITESSSISEFSVTQLKIEQLLKPRGFRNSIRRWSYSKEYFDQLYVNISIFQRLRIVLIELVYRIYLLLERLTAKLKKSSLGAR